MFSVLVASLEVVVVICCSDGNFENSNTQIADGRGLVPPEIDARSDNDYQHVRCGYLSKVVLNKRGSISPEYPPAAAHYSLCYSFLWQ